MKKFLIALVVLIIGAVGQINAEVVRNGNTFETVQTSQTDVQTPYTWKDKDGKTYPVYITKKGACYIKRVSKKTGKEYKYYLPKEIQEQIRKELGI